MFAPYGEVGPPRVGLEGQSRRTREERERGKQVEGLEGYHGMWRTTQIYISPLLQRGAILGAY